MVLWRALKTRPAGLKFRRQHPLGPYVLDFACLAVRLAIEVDSEAHGRGDRPARDEVRDAWLAAHGFRVLRFTARDTLTDLDAIVRAIAAAALPLHHQPSAGGPPRRTGEVLA